MGARHVDDANASSGKAAPTQRAAVGACHAAVHGTKQGNGIGIGLRAIRADCTLHRTPDSVLGPLIMRSYLRLTLKPPDDFSPDIGCALVAGQPFDRLELETQLVQQST